MSTLDARAIEVLGAYMELARGQRARALAVLRASDPQLHAEVAKLLAADAMDGALLRSPQEILAGELALASRASSPSLDGGADPRIGSVLGAWRVEAVIGAGGMGTVYRASRSDGQYAQVVALKCARTEIDSPALADAIRNERSALAQLEHPNIATLLDGGIDDDGRPWFAMQLVQGEPIDRWCDQRRLGLRERMELFVRLCDGLAYAHGKSTLHSDLKPSNVLVDGGGRPVLLDFGLSSLTGRGGEARRRQIAMTLDYTAPEVPASGYSIRSDVFALGVMLCELLCGARPMQGGLPGGPRARARLPSELASSGTDEAARARGVATAARLARSLAGDLDRIVMACIAQDPAQRYPSVDGLQADLRAWLQHRPVSMRAFAPGYRLGLFLRRHRRAAILAVAGLLCLGVGLGLVFQQREQARVQAEAARSMRTLLEESFHVLTTSSLGRSPLVSREMLVSAEQALRSNDGARDPRIRAHGLMALAKSYTTLGDYRQAMALVTRAQVLLDGEPAQRPAIDVAIAHLSNEQSLYAQAHVAAAAGLSRIADALAAEREETRLALEVELARALWGMAKIEQANATLQHALVRAEAIAARNPAPLAALLVQRGQWHRLFSRFEDAMRDFERAYTLTSVRAPMTAASARAEMVGTLTDLNAYERAIDEAAALLDTRTRQLGSQHPETGKAWVLLADSQFWSGKLEQALQSAQAGQEILRATLGPEHPEVAEAIRVIDGVYAQTDRPDDAVLGARRVLAIMQRAHGPDHQATLRALRHLAAVLAVRASSDPANTAPWQEIISLFERIVRSGRAQGLPMLSQRMLLIKAKLRVGRIDAGAERELAQVIAGLSEARGALSDAVRSARFTLIEVLRRQGRLQEVEAMLQAMLLELDRVPRTLSAEGDRFNCLESLGDLELDRGEHAVAQAHWRQAHEIGLRIGPGQVSTKRVAAKLAGLEKDVMVARR